MESCLRSPAECIHSHAFGLHQPMGQVFGSIIAQICPFTIFLDCFVLFAICLVVGGQCTIGLLELFTLKNTCLLRNESCVNVC